MELSSFLCFLISQYDWYYKIIKKWSSHIFSGQMRNWDNAGIVVRRWRQRRLWSWRDSHHCLVCSHTWSLVATQGQIDMSWTTLSGRTNSVRPDWLNKRTSQAVRSYYWKWAAAGLSSSGNEETRSTHQLPPIWSISTQARQTAILELQEALWRKPGIEGIFESQKNRRGHTSLPPAERMRTTLTTLLLSFTYIIATPTSRQPLLLDWSSGYPLTIEGFAYL